MRNIKKTLSLFMALAMMLTTISFMPDNVAYAAAVNGLTVTINEDNSVTVTGADANLYYLISQDDKSALADDSKTVADVTGAGFSTTQVTEVTEADDGKTLYVIATAGASDSDAVTKAGSAVITYHVEDDTDVPEVPTQAPVIPDSAVNVPNVNKGASVTVAVPSIANADTVEYALITKGSAVAGATWKNFNAPVTVTTGNWELYIRATNVAGTTTSAAYNIVVDNEAPVFEAPVIGKDAANRKMTVTLKANDSLSGLQTILYSLDGMAEQTYTTPIVINTVGEHTVVYRAIDKAGNVSASQTQVVNFSYVNLMTVPTVRMLDDTPNNEYIRFRLQDFNIELFDYSYQFVEKGERVDKSDWEYCSGATYMEIDEEGEWDLYIMVEYDDYSDYGKVASCVIDQTEPDVVKVIQPKANSKTNFNITVDARDELSRNLEYSFDGGKTWSGNDSKTYRKATVILAGDIQVRDEAGNIAESGFCGVVEMDGRKTVFTEDPDSIDSNIVDKDTNDKDTNKPDDDKNQGNTGNNNNNSGSMYNTKPGITVNTQAVNTGYMSGYEDNTFRPDNNITRSELATILTRVFNFQNNGYNNFTDVSNSHWAFNSISAVQSFGMFQTNGSYFMPSANVTRAEVAHAICQFIDTSNVSVGNNPYNDINGSSYMQDILKVSQLGIMTGYGSNNFGPNDVLTRAQVVTIINRLIGARGQTGSVYFTDVTTSHWAYNDIMLASR